MVAVGTILNYLKSLLNRVNFVTILMNILLNIKIGGMQYLMALMSI